MPPFEDELGQALRRTGDSFSTDQQRLADTGLVKGRRTLRRRRAGAITGSVAALALVGVGGAWAGGLLGGTGGGRGDVAAPVPSVERTSGKGSAEGDGRNETGKAEGAGKGDGNRKAETATGTTHPITAAWMTDTFKRLMPRGELTQVEARGTEAKHGFPNSPMVSAIFDDGKGKAAVLLGISRTAPKSQMARELVTCPARAYVRFDACNSEKLSDGSDFMLLQRYVRNTGKAKEWRATLVTPDGLVVDVSEHNAPAEKGKPVSRVDPPLDPHQLKKLTTDGAWRTVTGALPEEKPADDVGIPGEPGVEEMQKDLAALLPKGLKLSDKSGQAGFASLVVNDGKGGSLVEVNAQLGMSDLLGGKTPTEPDGTVVTVSRSGGDKDVPGIVMLTVDTVKPDGRRVVISAFNSDTQHSAPTRKQPALTAEQLKAIALDPTWWK
ncbi:hypothetical protein GCM10010329_66750 [Streptomyces spiroverticillatus]|uniref:LigA protein n=1 Tax=Streptomyces finlayi TaxID=67296 RepID=A0A919CEC1_9ACTN|nr:hypothetical protein [Streptomyces finlayi]GHA34243.1 hypothetical protein GCM10010329_66750 [Streptomyces spiroverticillatus]GHD11817.1 hypothetical protein GCM10010334_68300 [Streptomyces finlayi]